MKTTVLFVSFILMLGCNSKQKKELVTTEILFKSVENKTEAYLKESSIDSVNLNINFHPKGNYSSILSEIELDKSYFKNLYRMNKEKAFDSVSKYIYSKLLNDIVPHWYGTPWDFNGHTNSPNNGKIACGYFVSTTLKHLGFKLNRYKMAQAAGLDEAKLLQPRYKLKTYSNITFDELKTKVNKVYSDGIYFVGLDNHVGYVLIKNKELYFLHSSYCDDEVVIELAENSTCFGSNLYVFAEITTNKKLIKSWILSERLSISIN
jgi:hypothetical protein